LTGGRGDVLVVADGQLAGSFLVFEKELRIGRDAPGTASLGGDPRLSRWHARLAYDNGGTLQIEDLGSSNGTFVNGVRIDRPRRLAPDDLIVVGGTMLRVERKAADSPETVAIGDLPAPKEQVGSPSDQHSGVTSSVAPLATIVKRGERIPVPPAGLTIGRLPENDVPIPLERVSRHHALVVQAGGRYYVADLASRNGTYLNGERLLKEARWLNVGDEITIGGEPLRFLTGQETAFGLEVPAESGVQTIRFTGDRMKIGRDHANDIVLDGPGISRFHAEVVNSGGTLELRDLGSRNGTRLNGKPVSSATVGTGAQIGVGSFRLIFDGSGFVRRDDRGSLRLDAYDVSVAARHATLLNRATLSVQPGEFVAIIGESGSGKTTFLKAMAGIAGPSGGSVLINGEPVLSRLDELGYLPQDEIVHPRLTVIESLRYSARLRLPGDSSREDIEAAVARVLADTSLEQQVHTRIGSLSGGERKRVGLATELLNRPGLLFLDEPTTALDPGLKTRMMALFRELAAVGRQAIVVVTHDTKDLARADKLCVMGRGGEVCYVGSPAGATAFFGVSSFDEIYAALDDRPAVEWRQEFESGSGRAAVEPPPAAPQSSSFVRKPDDWVWQARILAQRYATVFARDRRNLLILLAQAPLLAIAIALLFKRGVFGLPGPGIASAASQLVFLLVVTTVWLGAVDGSREIIKERSMFARERAIGVRIPAYLASKLAVLLALVVAQTVMLLAVVLALRPLQGSTPSHVGLLMTLLLTGFDAVAMGLLISSLVHSEDQATAALPVAMIVQLLLGGAIVTVKNMGNVMGLVSAFVFARWSYAGAGRSVDMNARIAADPSFGAHSPYSHSFFSVSVLATSAILLVFFCALLATSAAALRRKGGV
jgi:ABC-type multidrug transport system ATPase subunit